MKLRSPAKYHDKSELWEAEHFRRRCVDLAQHVNAELVKEHQANPFAFRKHHSLVLQRVDRLLKTYPAAGRRLLPVLGADDIWRVMVLRREEPAQLLDEPKFKTLEEIVHHIFKLRLESLKTFAAGAHHA